MPVIGYLNASSPESNATRVAAFRKGLSEMGFVEDRNLAIEFVGRAIPRDRLAGIGSRSRPPPGGRDRHTLQCTGGSRGEGGHWDRFDPRGRYGRMTAALPKKLVTGDYPVF